MLAPVESFEALLGRASDVFRDRFRHEPTIITCAPGRVNLIGEHIDYNDGFVLPMALPMVTLLVGSRNGTESQVNLVTVTEHIDKGQSRQVTFDVTKLSPGGDPKWLNYVTGVINYFPVAVPGFDAVIATNVPIGGGLSSSAALEVSTLTFLEALTKHPLPSLKDRALLCQKAEQTFAGLPCGVMDQMISVMGRKGHALLLDCRSCSASDIPFQSDNLAILICNSNVKHELSSSEYPVRKAQCEEALKLMQLASYRDVDSAHIDTYLAKLQSHVHKKRARHVISEIDRTIRAAEALKAGNFKEMGRLMVESHRSLSEDFEVSCKELDILVEEALSCDGVYGSRMTGGGFGGCTVTLIERNAIPEAIKKISTAYAKRTVCEATFYLAEPNDGARVIKKL